MCERAVRLSAMIQSFPKGSSTIHTFSPVTLTALTTATLADVNAFHRLSIQRHVWIHVWIVCIETPSTDEVAEWLRRWTANPLCSARVGSNPILVESA